MTDITELTGAPKHANQHRISRIIVESPNDELRQMTVEVEQYTDQLIEALEKAQHHIARQEQILLNQDESLSIRRGELEKAQAQSSKWLEAYHKAVSIGARYEERIAELESRTVKLPEPVGVVGNDHWIGEMNMRSAVIQALKSAGIKVEAE